MIIMTTAVEMAKRAGIDAKIFRQALREKKFPWHVHNDYWTVEVGSRRHSAMEGVLQDVIRRRSLRSQ
jgi:hypothetical protein